MVHQGEQQGLVLVDRNTVPVGLGDIMLSFGAHPAEVPGRVRFLHPLHNFAILSYNPQDLPKQVSWQTQLDTARCKLVLGRQVVCTCGSFVSIIWVQGWVSGLEHCYTADSNCNCNYII